MDILNVIVFLGLVLIGVLVFILVIFLIWSEWYLRIMKRKVKPELKPLTPEQIREFNESRKNTSVVDVTDEPLRDDIGPGRDWDKYPYSYVGDYADDTYFDDLDDVLVFSILECENSLNAVELWKKHKTKGDYHRSKNWIEQTLKSADGYQIQRTQNDGSMVVYEVQPARRIRIETGHVVSRPRRLKMIASFPAGWEEEE